MFLKDFIAGGGAMFTDAGGLFDAGTLTTRATLLFGYRTIREDIPADSIAAAGQNVIDTQRPFLTALFDYASKFNPFQTARRETTHTGAETEDTENSATKTNTGTRTTTNSGTITTEGNATDTPNVVTSITKSAYNATESRPAETTTNSGTNTAQSSGTTTNDLTDTTTDNLTETTSDSTNSSRSCNDKTTEYSVSGADEIQRAFDKYIQPYDYLAREIVNQICNLFW